MNGSDEKRIEQTERMKYLGELINAQLENRVPAKIPDSIDISEIVDVAQKGHMTYLLIGALLKTDLPKKYIEEFQGRMVQTTLQTLTQVCMIKELEKRFEESGIRFQMLKGAILKGIYPSPEMREMSDIDMMVYESTIDRAAKIVENMGFEKERDIKHHAIYIKKPFIILEVHWSLYDKNVDKNQYLYFKENFMAEKKEDKDYTYDFSIEDFYVYMISHMAKHFYETGCGIRNLIDIYVYMEKYESEMDPKAIVSKLEICGLIDFEHHMRKLAYIWLRGEQSTEFYNALFAYMEDCGIYGKGENGVWGQIAGDHAEKFSAKKYYFPSVDYMANDYPWLKKAPIFLPVAWVLRSVRGISKKGGIKRGKVLINTKDEQAMQIWNMYRKLKLDFKK